MVIANAAALGERSAKFWADGWFIDAIALEMVAAAGQELRKPGYVVGGGRMERQLSSLRKAPSERVAGNVRGKHETKALDSTIIVVENMFRGLSAPRNRWCVSTTVLLF
jgi:hypothetical protein